MKRIALGMVALGLLATTATAADPPKSERPDLRRDTWTVSGTLAPSAEMWFYEQERRRAEDPDLYRMSVARSEAEQRRARINARKWYGMSAARPNASCLPWFETYGPTWTSGGYNRFDWSGTDYPSVGLRPEWARIRLY